MAKLSEKRRAQLKEAQRKYRENKRLNGVKQVSIWVKEPDSLITNNQMITSNQITGNQELIICNQQLEHIKLIVSDYEKHAHPSSVRWDIAKKLIAELKKVL